MPDNGLMYTAPPTYGSHQWSMGSMTFMPPLPSETHSTMDPRHHPSTPLTQGPAKCKKIDRNPINKPRKGSGQAQMKWSAYRDRSLSPQFGHSSKASSSKASSSKVPMPDVDSGGDSSDDGGSGDGQGNDEQDGVLLFHILLEYHYLDQEKILTSVKLLSRSARHLS
jgi:hypothetical protein